MRWVAVALVDLVVALSFTLGTAASALITLGSVDTPGSALGTEVAGGLARLTDER